MALFVWVLIGFFFTHLQDSIKLPANVQIHHLNGLPMHYKMTYPAFLTAANKHHLTCQHLTQAIETLDNASEIKQLTLNLYYLSGYIIECAIKYGIYQNKADKRDQSIEHIAQSQGKPFKQKIFSHKFSNYHDYLEQQLSGIVLVHGRSEVNSAVQALYNHWDAEVRYYCDEMPKVLEPIITYPNVKEFNRYAGQILKDIKTRSLGK